MDFIETLGLFGLTRQEAGLYLILSAEGELSGYEAARRAGISRSNAYASLASLTGKGAACRLDGATPLYAAMSVREFCGNRLRNLRDAADSLAASVPARTGPSEGYLTIEGAANIVDRLRTMVEQAKERIYLALPDAALRLLLTELRGGLERGIKLVVITDHGCDLAGATLYLHPLPADQVRLIADSHEVITGELGAGPQASCLYSRRKQL